MAVGGTKSGLCYRAEVNREITLGSGRLGMPLLRFALPLLPLQVIGLIRSFSQVVNMLFQPEISLAEDLHLTQSCTCVVACK